MAINTTGRLVHILYIHWETSGHIFDSGYRQNKFTKVTRFAWRGHMHVSDYGYVSPIDLPYVWCMC